MRKMYPFVAVLTLSSWAHAQDDSFFPEAKLTDHHVSTFNVGAGFTQKLLHLNGEWVNPYGIAYAKVGVFMNGDKAVGGQVGFRYPYYLTGTDKNGYYIGVYAGHLESKLVDGDDKTRLGGGVDLAYVWLNAERVSTVSAGIGAAEKLTDRQGNVVEDTKPQIQFSYSLSFGI